MPEMRRRGLRLVPEAEMSAEARPVKLPDGWRVQVLDEHGRWRSPRSARPRIRRYARRRWIKLRLLRRPPVAGTRNVFVLHYDGRRFSRSLTTRRLHCEHPLLAR